MSIPHRSPPCFGHGIKRWRYPQGGAHPQLFLLFRNPIHQSIFIRYFLFIHLFLFLFILFIYVCMYVCMYACIYLYICVFVCNYTYAYLFICVSMFVYYKPIFWCYWNHLHQHGYPKRWHQFARRQLRNIKNPMIDKDANPNVPAFQPFVAGGA